jgi:hypothetical protein
MYYLQHDDCIDLGRPVKPVNRLDVVFPSEARVLDSPTDPNFQAMWIGGFANHRAPAGQAGSVRIRGSETISPAAKSRAPRLEFLN